MKSISRACSVVMLFALRLAAQSDSAPAHDSLDRDPHAVQPERPTIATHAGTVARGWVEFEEGGEWDKTGRGPRSFFAPTNLKIGLASHVQLNVQVNLIDDMAIRGGTLTMSDITVGVKYRIVDRDRILGDFAILPAVKLPTASEGEGGTGTTDFSLLLISSREIGPVEMDLNVGQTFRSGNGNAVPTTSSLWTASFGFPIYSALGATFEIFGYPPTSGPVGDRATAAILAGPTLLVRKWLAVDSGIITPLTGSQPHAIYAGFVWNAGRLPFK